MKYLDSIVVAMKSVKKYVACSAVAIVALLILGVPKPVTAQVLNEFLGFYYDQNNTLLQVEIVPPGAFTGRLERGDWSPEDIPAITKNTKERLICSSPDQDISKLAAFVVYYRPVGTAVPATGESNVRAIPRTLEYLDNVVRTTIKCTAKAGDDPCIYPKRCHCLTGSCCCW
jgi:hypothetical protein